MDKERIEQELQEYFKAEVNKAEPPAEWWNNAISQLDEKDQHSRLKKPTFWNLRPSLIAAPLSIFLLIILVGSLIAGMGGMALPPPQPPAMVADGSGGAFVFWYETPYNYGTGLYANHIDAKGKYLWGTEGKHLAMGKVSPPEAISDGDGGAIVAWVDDNNLHVERLNFIGDSMWTWEEVNSRLSLLGITADSSGGAIILWQDRNEQGYVQGISAEGASLWGAVGTFIGKTQYADFGMPLVSDGSGGAMVIWQDPLRKGIYAQRVNQDGELLWAEGGVAVTSLTGEKDRPQFINDGNGNLIIAWSEISTDKGFNESIYIQKLDTGGNRLWGEQGIVLDGGQAILRDPQLTADSSGGCIVTWLQTQFISVKNSNIYAQRVDSAGEIQWQEGGVPVSDIPQNSPSPDLGLIHITGDGAGDSTVIWVADIYAGNRHDTQVYAQKLSPDGQRLWSQDGIEVYQNPTFQAIGYSDVTGDGSGGFIIGSKVSEGSSVSSTDSVYSQRINLEGNRLWGEGGLEIQLKHSSPVLPIMASIIIVVTIVVLVSVFRRNRLAGIFMVITPVLIGIAALFGNLLLNGPFGYNHSWAYVLNTPINMAALVVMPIAGLSIVSVGIWKRTLNKWLIIPILVFCALVAAITGLILFV